MVISKQSTAIESTDPVLWKTESSGMVRSVDC